MALTDLTRISTSGIATGSTIDSPILRKDVDFRGNQVGVTSVLFDSSERELNLKDNVKLTFGDRTNGDLQVYHTGSHSYVQDTATGNLILDTNGYSIKLTYNDSENMLRAIRNDAVELYWGNFKKFETAETGAIVTGILTATSFSGPIVGNTSSASGISTFYDLRVTNNLTVEGTSTTLDTNLIGVDRVEIDANSNTIAGIAVTQSGTADIVNLFDGNTKVLTVKDGGRVGIGTDAPARDFHVTGTSRFEQLDVVGFATFGSAGTRFFHHTPRIEMQGSNTATISFCNATTGTTNTDGMLMGFSSSSQVGFINVNESAHGFVLKTGGTAQNDERIRVSGVGTVSIRSGTEEMVNARPNSGVELYFNGNKRLETTNTGVDITDTLNVAGVSTFTGNINANGSLFIPEYIKHSGDIDSRFGFSGTDTFAIDTAGAERLEINSSGTGRFKGGAFLLTNGRLNVNYDIAHSSTYYLDNDAQILVSNGDSTGTKKSVLKLGGEAALVYGGGSSSLIIADRQNERLRINSAGKVGIGTNNPSHLLHIFENGAVGSTENDRKYNGRFTTRTPNNLNLDIYDRRWQDTQTHGWEGTEKRLEYNIDDNTSKRMWMSFFNPDNAVTSNVIRFGEQEDTEWMRIYDGKVGIGSANPESKLTVAAGSATAQIEIQRTNGSGGGTIGALNFTAVTGYSVANISAVGQGDNDGAHLVFRTTDSAGEHSPFGGSTNEHLRITSGGKIGIATASPTAKLTIGRVTGGYMNTTGIQVNRPHSLGLQNGVLVYTDAGYNNTATYRAAAFKAVGTSGIALAVSTDAGNNGLGGTLNAKIDFDGDAHFLGNTGIGTDNPLSRLDVRNASGTNPLLRLHHSNADVEGEVIRIGRTELPTIRYHSIKAKHSGNSLANYISVNVHDGGGNPYTSQTEVVRFLGAGGMTFNGDTAAANALNDYEEGSWTPTVLSEGNIGTPQYTCTYTKIGRLVTINADIHQLSDTTSNTNIKIGGLPYVPSGTSANWSAVCHGERYGHKDVIVAYIVYNSGAWGINFRYGVPLNHYSYVKHSNISDDGTDNNLRFTLTYEVA